MLWQRGGWGLVQAWCGGESPGAQDALQRERAWRGGQEARGGGGGGLGTGGRLRWRH